MGTRFANHLGGIHTVNDLLPDGIVYVAMLYWIDEVDNLPESEYKSKCEKIINLAIEEIRDWTPYQTIFSDEIQKLSKDLFLENGSQYIPCNSVGMYLQDGLAGHLAVRNCKWVIEHKKDVRERIKEYIEWLRSK